MKCNFVMMTACLLAVAPLAVNAQSTTQGSGSSSGTTGSSMSSGTTTGSAANRYSGMRDSDQWERSHRASKIIGTDVVNRQGDKIGDVEDVVLDNRGAVAYAVVSTGGFLGVGERWHAVPWRALNTTDRSGNFVLDIDRNRLSQAPGFTRDNWPNVSDSKWTSQNSRYFGSGSGSSSGTSGPGSSSDGSGMSGSGTTSSGTSNSGTSSRGSGMSGSSDTSSSGSNRSGTSSGSSSGSMGSGSTSGTGMSGSGSTSGSGMSGSGSTSGGSTSGSGTSSGSSSGGTR